MKRSPLLVVGLIAATAAAAPADAPPLLAAREGFATELQETSSEPAGPPAEPPAHVFRLVRYRSPAGELAAYVTPDPGDGRRRPALIWAHGGFGGIGPWLWEEPQYTKAFRAAGLVVFCPSWRGENDNPGRFELFYGEVDDAVAAIEHVASLPYVDPTRIYMAGHSTGGTITLLTALATTDLRAAFSFGGAPDLERVVADGGYGNTPYDPARAAESQLRSATRLVDRLATPTYYFEGEDSSYVADARRMAAAAAAAGTPFQAFEVLDGDHFDILEPLTALLAERLALDRGDALRLRLSQDLVQERFDHARLKQLSRRLAGGEDTAELRLARSRVQRRRGDPRQALADCERAALLAPGDLDVLFERALVLEGLGRLEEAILQYTRVLAVAPDDAVSHYNRALLRARQGDLRGAEEDLERVLELDPGDALAREHLELLRAEGGLPARELVGLFACCGTWICLFVGFILFLRHRSRRQAARRLGSRGRT